MEADDLYGLSLDRFVAERGALAKSLRKAGHRDEAAEVAALRKPSVAAWAVNQLVRTQHAAVRALFAVGDELRDAQADLLSGSGDARTLRTAGDHARAMVDELVEVARGLLSSAGDELSATVLERVSDALHAAALDDAAREEVRHGRLVRELRHVGFGLGVGLGDAAVAQPAPRRAGAARSKPATAGRRGDGDGGTGATREEERAARERATKERAENDRLQREWREARTAARAREAAARRRASSAADALEAAEKRRAQAARELADAEESLVAVREDAARAGTALEHAQAELDSALHRD